MFKTPLARGIALASLGLAVTLPSTVQAAFLEDSKASLMMQNFYMNSDNREEGAKQNYAEDWAQGFILDFQSGYTEGAVGFGIDALGLLGVKLDSGPGRVGTGLLPKHNSGDPADEYSKIGITLKMKYSETTAKAGTFRPSRPTAKSNFSRLLPQTFRGYEVESKEVKDLTLLIGRYTRISKRDSPANEKMYVNNRGISGASSQNSDKFDFAAIEYKWNDNLTTRYDYAELDNVYTQHFFTLVHSMKIGGGKLKTDFRFADSSDDGQGTNTDNRALGLMLTYGIGGHKFGAGWQKMTGDTGFAYINGTDPYLVNYVQVNHFANPDEKSWQLRYDYDFAAIGIPGLTLMTRYIDGYDMRGKVTEEWERNTDIAYTFQDGLLKDLGLKWRNATFRQNNGGKAIDQNRLIISYTIPLM